MQVLQSDRGREFTGTKVIQFLDDNSIADDLTHQYTLEHNGSVERKNQRVFEWARSILNSSDVHLKFWGEANHIVIYTLNCAGSSTLNDVTELLHSSFSISNALL